MVLISQVIARMESAGITLSVNGPKLVVESKTPLTDSQRSFLKEHKPEILEVLQPANDPAGTAEEGWRALSDLAHEFGYPLSDLLEFYREDLEDLRVLPTEQARAIVADHVETQGGIAYDPAMEKRQKYVLQKLREHPEITRAWLADGSADPVRVHLAIRGKGSCELAIAADKWDEFRFLELLERQGGTA